VQYEGPMPPVLKAPRRKQRGMFCLAAVLRSPVRNSPYLDSLAVAGSKRSIFCGVAV